MDSLNSKLKTQNSKLDRNAWWLTTGRHRPAWQALTAAGVATFTGRPAAHFKAARPGDPVLIYLARPDHAIRAVGVVARGAGIGDRGSGGAAGTDPRTRKRVPAGPDP